MRIVQFFPQDDILEISYKNVFREIFAKDTPNARVALQLSFPQRLTSR